MSLETSLQRRGRTRMDYALLRLMRLITNSQIPIPQRYRLVHAMPRAGIIEGYVGSYVVSFDAADHVQRHIYLGMWERTETIVLCALLRPGDVAFDVGANIGYYSLVTAALVAPGGSVHAFEPLPETYTVLQRTIKANNIGHIVLNQMAVGDQEGDLTLYMGNEQKQNHSEMVSALSSERGSHPVQVAMTTLDRYVQQHGIDRVRLVKLDIEGYELQAFRGMEQLMAGPDAPDVICEISPYWLSLQGLDSRDLTRYLATRGYTLYSITESYWSEVRRPFRAAPPLPLERVDPERELGFTNLLGVKDPARLHR